MVTPAAPDELSPTRAAVDENGVDRDQIRRMLALPPEDRLRRMEEFLQSVLDIRELNERRPIR